MSERILDGMGRGYEASVDASHRLSTFSTSENEITSVSRTNGQSFVYASGPFITVDTANTEVGIFHLKNDDSEKHFYIEDLRTCGTQIQKWRLYRDSDAGTMFDAQSSGIVHNLNRTSSNIPTSTVLVGSGTATVTNGTMMEHWINDVGHSSEEFDGALILGRDDSFTLTVELLASGEVCTRTIGFFLTH